MNRKFNPFTMNFDYLGGDSDGTGVSWLYPYEAGTHPAGTMTRVGDWTTIANTETDEYPVPTSVGDKFTAYNGEAPTLQYTVNQLIFGTRITAPQTATVRPLRIYKIAGNRYEIYSITDPLGAGVISYIFGFEADSNGWVDLNIGSFIVQTGAVFDIVAIVREPDPTPVEFTGSWDYQKPTNITVPTAGQATQSAKEPGKVLINFLDDVGGDRTAELSGLEVGDLIKIADVTWAVQAVTPQVGYIEFDIAPASQAPVLGVQALTFETVTATPITILEDPDYYLSTPNVDGLFVEDGSYGDVVANNNAYGIDVEIQYLTQSTDWDIVASSSSLGGVGETVEKTIRVAKAGAEFSTIEDAMNSIADNSSANRYCIKVSGGEYDVDNPIQGKDFVTIEACGTRAAVLRANNTNEDLFVGGSFFHISGCILSDVTGVGKYAVNNNNAGRVVLFDCILRDCSNGTLSNHPDATMEITNIGVNTLSNPFETVFKTEQGVSTINGVRVRPGAIANNLFHTTGADAFMSLTSAESGALGIVTGLRVENGSLVSVNNLVVQGATDGFVASGTNTNASLDVVKFVYCSNDGFRVDNIGTGLNVQIFNGTVVNNAGFNFNVLNPNSATVGSGYTQVANGYIHPDASFNAYLLDTTEDDEGLNVFGEIKNGSPERPSEACFGEGDSYVRGMLAYTYDGASYVDVTEENSSASGSTITFPNVNTNTAIYMTSTLSKGGDFIKIPGLKTKLETAMDKGTGGLVFEYWNGTAWTEVNAAEYEASGDYMPHAKQYLEHEGSHQVRFNILLGKDSWTANDPMGVGTSYYWMRLRIASPITASPVIEQIKLHSNRMEINGDGFPEYFGSARPLGKLPWSVTQFQPAGTNLADLDHWFSDNLDIGGDENYFNASGDRSGFVSAVPMDMDTSCPIVLEFAIRANDTGTLEYNVRWAQAEPNSSVYTDAAGAPQAHPNEKIINRSVTITAINEILWFREYLDVSDALSRRPDDGFADLIACTIQKVGLDVNFSVIEVNAKYVKWTEGGHI